MFVQDISYSGKCFVRYVPHVGCFGIKVMQVLNRIKRLNSHMVMLVQYVP